MVQFNLYKIKEISDFLSKLNINDSYVAIVEFTPDCTSFLADSPYLILAEDIIINRYSSAATIDKFISERLSYMVDLYYLDDSILFPINSDINPGINLYYTELEIKPIN
jgi:hypothetical protein